MLEHSPYTRILFSATIRSFTSTTSFGIETQNYNIDLTAHYDAYSIVRRYSDFLLLYQTLQANRPGVILPAFPINQTEESFSLKLGFGSKQIKDQFIARRQQLLAKFLTELLGKNEFAQYKEVSWFLSRDIGTFNDQRAEREKELAEVTELESMPSTTKLYNLTIGLFYGEPTTKTDQSLIEHEFKSIELENMKIKLENLVRQCTELLKLQGDFSSYSQPPTDIDQLLHLFATVTSGSNFCAVVVGHLQTTINSLERTLLSVTQTIHQLGHRMYLGRTVLTSCHPNTEKQTRLVARLRKFDNIFENEWVGFRKEMQNSFDGTLNDVRQIWANHAAGMQKIWVKWDK